MDSWIQFVGPNRALQVFGVKLVGINAENGRKLLFFVAFVIVLVLLNKLLRRLTRAIFPRRQDGRYERIAFWTRQGVGALIMAIAIIGSVSIWFDDPARLATAAGLVTAGLAFALQRVITALAGYIVILRGKTFNVGDRIVMGGVRGDVIGLGFIQTTIMEMGQPPSVNEQADPAMWVRSRQYTGRIVTVTNDKVFDTPVYNYTRDFPYIWEEMVLPVSYHDDRATAERILLDAAKEHAIVPAKLQEPDLREIERRFGVRREDANPRVFMRLTDNWVELSLRFLADAHRAREQKDQMSRKIVAALEEAGIAVASSTFEIVGLPKINIALEHDRHNAAAR